MNARLRREKATDLYQHLSQVHDELNRLSANENIQPTAISLARTKMACIEHQISLFRLTQVEDRVATKFLACNIWRAGIRFLATSSVRCTVMNRL